MPCVAVDGDDRMGPDVVIALCEECDAVSHEDGIEYCVQLRSSVGPELWTENALRRSL